MKNSRDNVKSAEVLQEVLLKTKSEGRLGSGLFECADVFRMDPDNKVRLCILPVTSSMDVAIHIQHKLIEAYCWENEVQLLKGLITSEMTFPDVVEETEEKTELDTTNVKTAQFLQEVLLTAMSEGRLTSGMFECANVFRMDPDKVKLCILPVSASMDVAIHIQHKLIEAYCWENEIPLLRVDSVEKLSVILNFGEKKMHHKSKNAMPVTTASVDCSCVIVTYPPKDERDKDDESYAFMEHILPHQVIELPPD